MNKIKISIWIIAIIILAYFILRAPSSSFDGASSKFSIVEDLTNKDLVLEKTGAGKIVWKSPVNVEYLNIDDSVKITKNRIIVDTDRLDAPAELSLYGLDYKFTPLIYRDGSLCPVSVCSNVRYSGDTLIFDVSGFTNYTSGANANMTIWDETDYQIKYINDTIKFFANYTNSTSGEIINDTKANCTIVFNESSVNMAFNSSSMLWEYNRSFDINGTYDWNVTCNGSNFGYEALLGSDTVLIKSTKPEVILDYPQNGYTDNDGNIIFRCNATDDKEIKNISLWMNSSGWSLNKTYYYTDKTYYNFSGITYPTSTHKATFGFNLSVPPNGLYVASEKEFNDSYIGDYNGGNYSEIIADDNDYASYTYGGGMGVPIQHLTFIISELSIDVINVTFSGYGCYGPGPGQCQGGYGVHLYIWNSTAWEEVGNHVSTEQIISKEYKDKKYINDTDKKLHLLVEGWQIGAPSVTIWTDFIQVWVNGTEPAKNITAEFNLTGINNGNYTWNCQAFDIDGQEGWDNNRTFNVNDIAGISIDFVSPTPDNETISANNTYINVTLSEAPDWIRLEWNGANETMNGGGTNWYKSKTDLANGNYTFKVYANDTNGNMNSTEIRWVYINYTKPNKINITAVEDVYTQTAFLLMNYDTQSFLKFNLSVIPSGGTIKSALLYISKTSHGLFFTNASILAYNCSDQDWNESSSNLTFYNMVCDYTGNITFVNGTNKWYSWNITDSFRKAYESGNANYTAKINHTTNDVVASVTDSLYLYSGYILGPSDNRTYFVSSEGATPPYVEIIIEYDNPPSVILDKPDNGNISYSGNMTFTCNATDDIDIANVSLWTNTTGSWSANQTIIVSGSGNTSYNATFLLENITSGNYTWNCQAYDNASQVAWGSSNRTFTVTFFDNILPAISVQSPQNTTYNYNTSLPLNYIASDANLDRCWYNLDGGQNTTLPNCNNATFNISEGWHTIFVYANDTSGNMNNTETVSFTIDITAPQITIQLPQNITYGYNTSLPLNYTVSDNNQVDKCWYNLDNGNNITLTNCQNATFNSSEGSHTLYLFANDTAGNLNISSISFTIDITPPSLSIQLPQNMTYNYNTSLPLNYTVFDSNLDKCWYNLDNGNNATLTNCQNATFNASEGSHTLYLFSNDTLGNLNNTVSVGFTIDLTLPQIAIQLPQNQTYNYTPTLNYTVSDADKCWYSNVMDNNVSLPNCNNLSYIGAEGWNTIKIYANDTTGNIGNSSLIAYTIDTIAPQLTVQSPVNATYTYTNISLNYTASGNIDNCWYYNTTGSRIDLSSCENTTFIAHTGQNNISIFVNDTAGNTNTTFVFFTVDTAYPNLNIQSPQNITYNYNTSLPLNYTVSDNNQVNKCWYNLDNGQNTTLTNCQNATFNASEGWHTLYLFANDTVGNLNSSNVAFTIDTIPPAKPIIQSPTNTTYSSQNINLNYTVTESSQCKYELDGANTTLVNCQNTTLSGLSQTQHYVKIWINDSANNWNVSDAVYFTVDITNPSLSIQLPQNRTYNYNTSLPLNYTVIDANLDKCWYNLDGNQNITLTNCANATFNVSEGWHRLYIYANDTSGNKNNSENVGFTIDLTYPTAIIQLPQNTTYNYIPTLNYTVSDNFFVDRCWYSNATTNNIPLPSCNNLSAIGADGWNSVIIYVNDSAGNIGNSSLIAYTIDTKPPSVTNPTADNVELGQNSFIAINATDPSGISVAIAEIQYPDAHRINYTMSPYAGTGYNLTFANTTTLGNYIVRFYVNDTFNNKNNTVSTSFMVGDYTSPVISVQSPQNTTYPGSIIALNYTVSDNYAVDKCWYRNTTGQNVTLAACQNTTFFASPGSRNIIVYVNDTSGNINSSQVYFSVTNRPVVEKILRLNSTGQDNIQFYLNSNVTFRVNVTDPDGATEIDKVLITIDAMNIYGTDIINATMNQILPIQNGWTYEYNHTLNVLGNYSITVFANDSWNAMNTNTTNLFVPPSIRLVSPKNGSVVRTGTIIDIEIDGPGVDKVWYSNDSANNYTIGAPYDINTTGWSEQENKKFDIWANDTSNNKDYRIYYFDFDDTKPFIDIISPSNTTYGYYLIDINFTVSDLNLDQCWYILNNGTNIILPGCQNTTITAVEGYNNVTVFANDSAGNQNSSAIFFSVDTTKPLISILSPQQNAIYNTTAVNLTINVTDFGTLQCNRTLDDVTALIGNIQSGVVNTTQMNVQLGVHYVNVTCADAGGNSNTSATVTFYVYDVISLIIDTPLPGQILHRGIAESLASTVTNSTGQAITTNVTWYTISEIAYQEDYNWLVPNNYPLGPGTIHANSTKPYHWTGYDNVSVFFYGWSRVNITDYSSVGGGYDKNITIECKVDDMNTSQGIQNYPVRFYNDTSLLGINITDASGYAKIVWHTLGAQGIHNLSCIIDHNSTLYYNATVNESSVIVALWDPEIWGAAVAPTVAGWNEQFNFSVFVRDQSGQRLYVMLWLSRNNISWTYQETRICNNCNVSTQLNFTKNNFACGDEGLWYFRFDVTNNIGGYNTTTGINFNLLKIILNNASVVITDGFGKKVGTRGDDYINLTANFFDSKGNRYLNNIRGMIWVKRRAQWIGYPCISDSNGNCTARFNPDCSFSGGKTVFKSGIYNDPCVENVNSSGSEITIDDNADCFHDVTLTMELNISGIDGDDIDPKGYYENIKYSCVDDSTLSGTLTIGIAFSGNYFRFVNTTNTSSGSVITLSQLAEGNSFILPMTKGGCGLVSSKMDLVEKFMPQTFAGFSQMKEYPVEIIAQYPAIDIVGEGSFEGNYVLNIKKEGNKIYVRRK